MDIVELRSDTFTKPTPEMRRAMADAEVGDDVWGEDPTAIALQSDVAERFGKEAALYVPSGTMGNEASLRAMTRPGDEVIVESKSHIVLYESGGPAALSGVMLRTIDAPSGALDPADVARPDRRGERAHRPPDAAVDREHAQRPRWAGRDPRARPRARGHRPVRRGSRSSSMAHGSSTPRSRPARRWPTTPPRSTPSRSASARGSGRRWARWSWGAPRSSSGSTACGQLFGGGMRQVGILCAAARVAFETGVERLAEDHANARRLAAGFAEALPRLGGSRRASTRTWSSWRSARVATPTRSWTPWRPMACSSRLPSRASSARSRTATWTSAGIDRAIGSFARAIAA